MDSLKKLPPRNTKRKRPEADLAEQIAEGRKLTFRIGRMTPREVDLALQKLAQSEKGAARSY